METQKWSRLYSLIIIFTVNDKLGKYKEQKIIGISRGYKIMEKKFLFWRETRNVRNGEKGL